MSERHIIRVSYSDVVASDRIDPLASIEIHTDDLLRCVAAVTGGLDIAPGVAKGLLPALYQEIEHAARQHKVGDRVVFTIVFRPGAAEADVGDAALLNSDLDPVGIERGGHADSVAESAQTNKTPSPVIDQIKSAMAAELARGEGKYPLLDGEDETADAAPGGPA